MSAVKSKKTGKPSKLMNTFPEDVLAELIGSVHAGRRRSNPFLLRLATCSTNSASIW